jgi:small subunit ribosomal protein S20
MTHSKQAAKRVRQSEKRRRQNRATASALKSAIRKVRDAGTAADTAAHLAAAMRQADKAAKSRVIHPNAAARYKSRLARLANKRAAATASA